MAEGRRRDRPPRALDIADRVGPGRSEAHSGLADRQLTAACSPRPSRPLTCANGADVTIGARRCLESVPMSRRSVRPHRGGGPLRASPPHPGPRPRSGPGRDDDRRLRPEPRRRPIWPRRRRRPSASRRRSRPTAIAPTCSTSSTCRRRTRSPTPTTRSHRPNRASRRPAAQEAGLRRRLGGRAALLYMGAGSGDPLGIDATSVQELGSARQVRRGRRRDRRPHDQPADGARRAAAGPDRRSRKAEDRRPDNARARPTRPGARSSRSPRRCSNSSARRSPTSGRWPTRSRRSGSKPQAAAERARIQAQAARSSRTTPAATGSAFGCRRHRYRPRQHSRAERRRRSSHRVRTRPDRQAVRLRRDRTRLVRLLRAHDDGVGARAASR